MLTLLLPESFWENACDLPGSALTASDHCVHPNVGIRLATEGICVAGQVCFSGGGSDDRLDPAWLWEGEVFSVQGSAIRVRRGTLWGRGLLSVVGQAWAVCCGPESERDPGIRPEQLEAGACFLR